jgi:murein DD-endopeptidase MepM/ murein hydrolase activator NlpD
MHRGIDMANNVGTPIVAARTGRVVFSGWHDGGYGYLVTLQHADGSRSLYAHNSRLMVSNGQEVRQGTVIALMGSTGRSTGPHLHFEIHPSGAGAVDPLTVLPPRA